MRILITGSSGQIGTNLALRLQRDGHQVFGVDKRLNTWTDDFRYLLQDLSGHYPPSPAASAGSSTRPTDLVVHLAAHAKVHQLVRQPAPGAGKHDHDLQRAGILPPAARADHLQQQPRGLRRCASLRHRGDQRRLRLHREHLLRLQDRRRGADLLLCALLRAALPRLPLQQRLRALRQRPRRAWSG